MKQTSAVDMTQGSETRHLIRFSLPLLAGNLLQQVYNIADTVIVGKCLGDNALAAVGATGSLNYLFYTLCLGLAAGAGIMISQYFGAGLQQRVRSAVWNSAIVTAVFGIVMSIAGIFLTEPALRLMAIPENLLPYSAGYMRIAVGGTLAVAAYNWINAVMRALGDSRTPLVFLGVSTALNIVGDLFFVLVLQWGVQGAAFATVLAQLIAAVGCILYAFCRMPALRIPREERKPDGKMMLLCVQNGLPIAAQNGMIAVSMVAIQRVADSFGETVMAAYTSSMRVEQLVQQPLASLGISMSTFSGQNIGAGKTERAEKGMFTGLRIAAVLTGCITAAFWLCGGLILRGFISGDDAIATGRFALRLTSLFYFPLGTIYVIRGFLNGAGDTAYAVVNGAAEVVCRVGGCFLTVSLLAMDYRAIWGVTCATWFFTGAVGWFRYRGGKWRTKSLTEAQR